MIIVKAKIFVDSNNRKNPIESGYRPHCKFEDGINTSGYVVFKDWKYLYPGDEAEVEVRFINKEYLGRKFGVGSKFIFFEANILMGHGEVLAFEKIEEG